MAGNNYKLLIELLLRDRASKGLSQFEIRLRGLDSQGKKTLATLKQLNQHTSKSARTNTPRINTPRINAPRVSAPRVSSLPSQVQELRLQRERTRLLQDESRLGIINQRAKRDSMLTGYRSAREEIALRRQGVGLLRETSRLSYGGEMQHIRLLRERMRLQRDQQAMARDSMIGGGMMSAAGLGGLALLQKGVRTAGDFEGAMADLRMSIAQVGKDGKVNLSVLGDQMSRYEALGMSLGNKLPGSSQDFLEMFSVLKQGGLQSETILNGTAEAVAHLAIVTGAVPKDLAMPFAQYAQQFQLTGVEAKQLSNTLAHLKFATGLDPQELIEGSKFFQLRAGAPLGLTGLKGGETAGRLLATMRSYGMEGGIGGRELGSFFGHLTFKTKEQQKALAELRGQGVNLEFFDKKGKFEGFENAFAQMEKLRKLSEKDYLSIGSRLFTQEGLGPSTVMMKAGVQGWNEINARIDQVAPLQELINQKTGTYNAKLESVKGTLENLVATSFTPMLNQLKPILDTANSLAGSSQEFAKLHPQVAGVTTEFIGLTSVSLAVAGGIKVARVGYGLWEVAARSAGVQTVGLSKKMMALNAVRVVGAVAGITLIAEAFSDVNAQASLVNETFEKNRNLARETYDLLVATGQIYGKDKSTPEQAKSSLSKLNAHGELSAALSPVDWKEYVPFMGTRSGILPDKYLPGSGFDLYGKLRGDKPYAPREPLFAGLNFSLRPGPQTTYDPSVAARRMESLIPEAHDPKRMAGIIKEAYAGGLGPNVGQEGINRFLESLKGFDTKAYQGAMAIVAEETKGFAEQSSLLTGSMRELFDPVNMLAPAAGRASIGLDGFAGRLGNFTLPTFNVGAPFNSNNPITGPKPTKPTTFTDRFGGGKAHGGRVVKDVTYIGGERGMELFTPATDGFVTPHHQLNEARRTYLASTMRSSETHTTIQLGSVQVSTSGNVESVISQVQSAQAQQIADLRSQLNDLNHFDSMGDRVLEIGEERA
jgi:TP901 family phage tail tape measure protein